jgi:adenylylsulfate kinase-like enzyme
VDDPYEAPLHAEITLNTIAYSPEENARLILQDLIRRGFVRPPETSSGS